MYTNSWSSEGVVHQPCGWNWDSLKTGWSTWAKVLKHMIPTLEARDRTLLAQPVSNWKAQSRTKKAYKPMCASWISPKVLSQICLRQWWGLAFHCCQKCELCSATIWAPPLESTHRELSFEWSHLWVSLDSSGFRSFLGLVKFSFGSERVKKNTVFITSTGALLMSSYCVACR